MIVDIYIHFYLYFLTLEESNNLREQTFLDPNCRSDFNDDDVDVDMTSSDSRLCTPSTSADKVQMSAEVSCIDQLLIIVWSCD